MTREWLDQLKGKPIGSDVMLLIDEVERLWKVKEAANRALDILLGGLDT